MQRTRVLLAVLVASAMFTATSAEAGVFIDAYGGYSLTQSKDIDTKNGVSLDFKDVDFDARYWETIARREAREPRAWGTGSTPCRSWAWGSTARTSDPT